MKEINTEPPKTAPLPRSVRWAAILLYAACLPAAMAGIYLGVLLSWKRETLEHRRSEWQSLQPASASAVDFLRQYEAKKRILDELTGWNNTRVSWYVVLSAFRDHLPRDMHPTLIRASGEITNFAAPQTDQSHAPPRIGRNYRLRACFQGESALDISRILNFVHALRTAVGISQYFQNIEMGGILQNSRDAVAAGGDVFFIDASGEKRLVVP